MHHSINDHFSPLGSPVERPTPVPSTRGNIIKSNSRPQSNEDHGDPVPGTESTPVPESHDPQIIVHRDGENITRIEYLCPCGRKSEISFEDDGE